MHRYVNVAVERDTPLDVLAAIREIHPTAELVYMGNGNWWMGYVKNSPAMDIGYEPPKHYPRTAYDLQRQGFRWLGEYGNDFVTAGFLRQEIEFMFGRTDAELAADMLAAEEVSDGTAMANKKAELTRRAVEQEGRSAFAHAFRARRGVLYPHNPITLKTPA